MKAQAAAEATTLRAAIARENKLARQERREAQATHTAALAVAPTNAGWSTKAPPAPRRAKPAVVLMQEQLEAELKARWGKRHPEGAKAERAFRKGRAEMLKRWNHKREGTPETHEHASRRCQGALARLYQSGAIDGEQLAAAVEIATVAERIGADVAVRTASLETRVDVTRLGDGTFYERLGQVRREMAYTRWRAALPAPAPVLDMIVEDTACTIVAKRYRMHNRRTKQLLIEALDAWPRMLGAVCKEVDDATLAAAHAGLLS
jgi:hypothetical protein